MKTHSPTARRSISNQNKVPSRTITSANHHSARLLTRGRPPTYHRSPTRERVLPLISTGDLRSIYRTNSPSNTNPLHMTPEENQSLINHYLTVVKQQRADNPPPPPFVDPLTPDERLDGIIKTVLADQESRLDQQIDFNRSLREYRAVKKMEATARRDSIYEFMIYLTSELLKDPRPTLHSRDFDATLFKKKFEKLEKILSNDKHNPLYTQNLATFNIRFERYQEALVQAQEIEVQATQTRDKTVIPTTKNLKIESRTAQTENIALPAPEVTGNIHLDNYLAKKSITEKPIDKKEKATKKKLLPLDSSIGDLSISSFTTEPYFEDLEPTTNLPSPALKKTLDELDEDLATPILNPSTLIPKNEQSNLENPIKVLKTPKEPSKHPGSLGIIREPLSSDESRASSEMESESESEDEIPEAEIIRILIKKQVKIHARYLKATSNDDKKTILDQAQQNQLVLQKLIPNKEIESYVNGWNPWIEKKKVFPAPPKNKKRPKSDKRNHPRQSGSNRPDRTHSNYHRDQTRSNNSRNQNRASTSRNQSRSNNNNPPQAHSNNRENNKRHREESEDLEDASKALSSLSTINHNLTTLEANHDVNTSKLLRVVEKCYVKSAKTLSEISDQLSDPLPVQMGPLEKSLVYHLKKEIDKVSNLVKDIHGTSNPEGIESLTTQIKYLRDTVYNLQTNKKNNSADIMEKLEQSEASILSNVKQDLITEVRVYVQKEVETLTTTVTTSFEGIMSQLRNMEQNSNDKFNHLQRDIVEIKKEIISVDNRVAKAESNRLTSPLSHSSPTPFKTVVETENKNSPSKDLPPHQTQSVEEDDDRGPRLTEKEVGKLLPPLSEWVSFSGEGEYDYIEFIQYCDLILETYWAKEDIVVVRLPRLFRGVAKVWWKTKSAAMGKASWQTWKDLMKAQFNTSTWRSKMKEAFRKEKLDPSVHVISTWCVAQHRRLECISPGLSLKEINEEILERCPVLLVVQSNTTRRPILYYSSSNPILLVVQSNTTRRPIQYYSSSNPN
ncbi:hypothetical protein H4Q26_010414 [Puccinia striiformis f. sp. tritici PST-130]|nr:hypothetical protein H4Q26_010414 [Puccinia striiformis f. sp. tritici PST-130]